MFQSDDDGPGIDTPIRGAQDIQGNASPSTPRDVAMKSQGPLSTVDDMNQDVAKDYTSRLKSFGKGVPLAAIRKRPTITTGRALRGRR
jgi:hypothetical protein